MLFRSLKGINPSPHRTTSDSSTENDSTSSEHAQESIAAEHTAFHTLLADAVKLKKQLANPPHEPGASRWGPCTFLISPAGLRNLTSPEV